MNPLLEPVVLFLLMMIATLIGAYGALFLKRGAASLQIHPRHWFKQHYLLLGGGLYAASTAVYIVILRFLPLSVAYPLTSMSYLWITALSKRHLGEEIDAWRWAAIILIITGVALLYMG